MSTDDDRHRESGALGGRPLHIGLTGPIGCGKSTVSAWLAELGAAVIDADALARDVTLPGQPTLESVIARFGEQYRRPDGSLDRARLGRYVFSDPDALRDLEAIVHPAVRIRIEQSFAAAERAGAPAVVVEAIKLVEGGLARLCDRVWLVTCETGVQRSRLVARGMAPADAEQRISAQGDIRERLGGAVTRTIDTSGSPESTRRLVREEYEAALSASR